MPLPATPLVEGRGAPGALAHAPSRGATDHPARSATGPTPAELDLAGQGPVDPSPEAAPSDAGAGNEPGAGERPGSARFTAPPAVTATSPEGGFEVQPAEAQSPKARTPTETPTLGRGPATRAPSVAPELAASVLRQVRFHLQPGQREASLHLEPAWLGRVSIRLAVRDGRARAELRAERPEALQALERHLPELRAALLERGFGETGLELELGLAGRDGQGAEPAPGERRGLMAVPAELAGQEAAPIDLRPAGRPAVGGIDTYA